MVVGLRFVQSIVPVKVFRIRYDDRPDGTFTLDYNNQFITDSIHGPNNRIWYRFKIPIDQHDEIVGGIQDFRAIRFIRMFLRGFEDDITLRFARLELARNQWRRYRRPLTVEDAVVDPNAPEFSSFDINDVNVEENSTRTPFGYTIPPGIQREQANNTAFANVLQNEQALAMNVCGMPGGFARGIYKNINFDLRLYEELEMFVHLEPVNDPNLQDDDLRLLLRMGSDFENNYYEYEVPLVISDTSLIPNFPNPDFYIDPAYKRVAWPEANDISVPLKEFTQLKQERNSAAASLNDFYSRPDPNNERNTIRIIGNPTLGPLKGIMIALVNRDPENDAHCAEVWVNELRVSGLDERGGMAAIGRVDLKLADLGDFTVAGEIETVGFGGLEERLQQRARERKTQVDLSTNLELGKFFGDKSGIKIPMYAQYSKTVLRPEFDPYDKDIRLEDKIRAQTTSEEKQEVKDLAQDVTVLKSLNFTNVRKVRTEKQADKKAMPWNIENFSVSYSYTEADNRDPFIESDKVKEHNGSLNYSYSVGKGTSIQPFKKLSKSKWLKLITDFNFNPVPNSFSFSTVMNREIQITKYRFTDLDDQFSTFYNKQFTWNRNYDLRWDLSKSLKFNFSAVNAAVIDELKNFDPDTNRPLTQDELNEEIWKNIRAFGRTKNYNHRFDLGYTVPTKQIPFLDWVQVKAQYNADYSWSAAALNVDSLGNVIQNSQRRQVTGDFNFESLYRKSKYLDRINRGSRGRGRNSGRDSGRGGRRKKSDRAAKAESGMDGPSGSDTGVEMGADGKLKKNKRKRRKNRKNKNADANSSGGPPGTPGKVGPDGKNADGKAGPQKGDKKSKKDKKKERQKNNRNREPSQIERILIRPLMTLRKARLSYSEDFGTVVPGFLPQTEMLGLSDGFGAPGWDFVGGLQPRIANNDRENDWLNQAAGKGWITDNILQNQQVLQNYSQDIRARITLEPFKDFRIELEADRKFTQDRSLYFRDTTLLDTGSPIDEIVHSIPREVGSFSMSYFAMQTLFGNDIESLFERFDANRSIISRRLGVTGNQHSLDGVDYAEGYGRLQQNVLIPAFLAAYTDGDANTAEIDADYTKVLFKQIPKINWQLTYNGLSKIPLFKEIFSNFALSHGYRSNLTVNSFSTDTDFDSELPLRTEPTSLNYYTRFTIPDIVIDEQFAPLIGIKVDFQNDLGFRIDWKKSRNLRLNFNDDRLNETNTEEYVFGFNYQLQGVEFGFIKNSKKRSKSRRNKEEDEKKNNPRNNNRNRSRRGPGGGNAGDLNFVFDFSYRNDITLFYDLKNGETQTVRGLKTIRISPSIDYDVNEQVNIRLFFERSQTIPATLASFPITNTQGGVTIRFSLN
ncbi:MAG: cell surface protein SprA [Bacteroidota bacterium]